MSTTHDSFLEQKSLATAAIAGITKYYSATTTLILGGVSYTPTQLVNLLQAYINAISALMALHAQLHDAVSDTKAQKKHIRAILFALQALVMNEFGSSSSKMGDFGFTPKKQAVESAATKAEAQVKAKATRAKNHPQSTATSSATGGSTPKA